jgi:DNA (cytosine-5)-methyltransferase 1
MIRKAQAPKVFRTLDLFCGCGGLTLGLSMARGLGGQTFQCVAAMDVWDEACRTFGANLGLSPVCDGVSRDSVARLLDVTGPIDIVTGGPPCQGFSTSGKRALDDPRNELVRAYLDAVALAHPRAFILENVTGFTTFQGGSLMAEVVERARAMGFRVFPGIVLASLHGVPQRRRRFIMVAVRDGEFKFPCHGVASPISTLFDVSGLCVDEWPGDGPEPWSFETATSDLAELAAGETRNEYRCDPQNEFQSWCRVGIKTPTDHVAVAHSAEFVEMMRFVPPGRSAIDPEIRACIPEQLRRGSGFANSYARIRGDQPAPTITRNFTTPSSANCIHPVAHRALSIREGARCQSFPDSFQFTGSLTDRRLLIGNAVPPLLARSIGGALLQSLVGETDQSGVSPARPASHRDRSGSRPASSP